MSLHLSETLWKLKKVIKEFIDVSYANILNKEEGQS